MIKEVPPHVEEAPLEQRIRKWIEANPGRSQAGERMLEQLTRIRSEFEGDTALRLEGLVEETLARQLRIDESRRQGLEAAKQLSETVQKLTESMSQCLLTAKRAHEAALGAAASAMQIRSKIPPVRKPATMKTITLAAPKATDKKLIN